MSLPHAVPSRATAPTRTVAAMRRRITSAELHRLALAYRDEPERSTFVTVSETSNAKRYLSNEEARWLLAVNGIPA